MTTSTNDRVPSKDIVDRTWEAARSPGDEQKFEDWRASVHAAEATTLVDVTAQLSSEPGKPSRDIKALREAIISEIECKNAQEVIQTMEKLDAAASKLTWMSVLLAVVGVGLAIVQVFQAFHR